MIYIGLPIVLNVRLLVSITSDIEQKIEKLTNTRPNTSIHFCYQSGLIWEHFVMKSKYANIVRKLPLCPKAINSRAVLCPLILSNNGGYTEYVQFYHFVTAISLKYWFQCDFSSLSQMTHVSGIL